VSANRCRIYKETEIACAAATTAKTMLMVTAAANIALTILDWCISFDGTSSTGEPILVELAKFTSNGTSTGSARVSKVNGRSETPQFTTGYNFTAEPSIDNDNIWDVQEIHPQTGVEFRFPVDFILAGSERLGIRVTIPSGGTVVNCRPRMTVEE